MNIVIFGATGATGRELVQQALDRHQVTAVAREPADLKIDHDRLKVVKGDILDPPSIESALEGNEAVLSTLGIRIFKKNTIISEGTRNILAAMKKIGIPRFICETALGLGDSRGQPAWAFNWIILPLLLRNVFADKEEQELLIMQSGLDWTIVRPPMLTNGERTGMYQTWTGEKPRGAKNHVSRADVADFMLRLLGDERYLEKAVGIAY
jgi:putative NADH-flavin reductase